jgi:hypothetical protein
MPKKKLTQALPSARRRENLKQPASQEWKHQITDLAMEAYRGPSPEDEFMKLFSVSQAPVIAQGLAEEYISVKYYKIPLKEFRRTTSRVGKSLRNKIHDLLESIPPDTQPPFPQMRKKFCGQEKAKEDGTNAEDLWDEAYSSAVVTHKLRCWIKLMDELNEEAGGRRAGADPITAEINFVLGLARYWRDSLNNSPSRWGENPYADLPKHEDAGPFPRFVREAAKIIPSEFSPKSWDWAIRSALEQMKAEAGKIGSEN